MTGNDNYGYVIIIFNYPRVQADIMKLNKASFLVAQDYIGTPGFFFEKTANEARNKANEELKKANFENPKIL